MYSTGCLVCAVYGTGCLEYRVYSTGCVLCGGGGDGGSQVGTTSPGRGHGAVQGRAQLWRGHQYQSADASASARAPTTPHTPLPPTPPAVSWPTVNILGQISSSDS